MDILDKIKKAGLVGRGGGCFSVWQKWNMVNKALADKKYVVCNAAEGEPGVEKDGYILSNYPERVIDGVKIAINFLNAEKGFLYINNKYYKKIHKKLDSLILGTKIEIFVKPLNGGYIAGEESSVLNAIEGKRVEPRLRPPYPTTNGLFDCPTLINNVETFYNVSLVALGKYENKRFYTVSGDCLKAGVYLLPDNFTIARVLKETGNYSKFPFFIQVGGNASGEILNDSQLKRPVSGAGSLAIYSLEKYDFKKFIKKILEFFLSESCGQCTSCREGVYRLNEMISYDKPDWKTFKALLDNLSDASFCGLGYAVPIPIVSFIKNVLPIMKENKIKIDLKDVKTVCECFK